MEQRLSGKTAVVTGAGRGIGAATARRFAAEGARVIVAELDKALGAAVASAIGTSARAVPTDVTSQSSVDDLFAEVRERWSTLDILVCNAGRPYRQTSLTTSEQEWDDCLNVNLRSAWYCAKEAFPIMRESGGGSIVTIASAQGLRSSRTSFPYAAAKGGLLALTRNLAVEYAPASVRVNAIIPGQIESVRTEPFFDSFDDPEEARRRVLSTFPLGRLGRAEDVAAAALFLASDDAEWVTGSWLTVDGGREAAQIDVSNLL